MFVRDDVQSREELFELFSEAIHLLQPDLDGEELKRHLLDREAQTSTSTPEGVAFPHALAPEIRETCVALARIDGGVDFGVPKHPRSDLVFCMFGNTEQPWEHVRLLARLARLVHTEKARDRLRVAADAEDLYARLLEEDRTHE